MPLGMVLSTTDSSPTPSVAGSAPAGGIKPPVAATRVILAADAVAYLPVFLANSFDLWMDGPTGRLEWSNEFTLFKPPNPSMLPPGLDKENSTGDLAVLNAIVHCWEKKREALIGICDPCELPLFEGGDKLALVGGLIRKACFWCVGDETFRASNTITGLPVEHLAIHGAGYATGYHIGHDLADRMSPTGRRHPVIYDGEIDLVVDGAVYMSQTMKLEGVMAITASVLSASLARTRGFPMRIPVHHEDVRFADFLTTGIVVPRDALSTDFALRLQLFLYGVIYGSNFFYEAPKATKRLLTEMCMSKDRFAGERRLDSAVVEGHKIIATEASPEAIKDVPPEVIKDTYNELRSNDLYSTSGDITDAQWNNAHFGKREFRLREWPPLRDYFFDGPLRSAQRLFADHRGEKLLSHELSRCDEELGASKDELLSSKMRVRWLRREIYALLGILVLMFTYYNWSPIGTTLTPILASFPIWAKVTYCGIVVSVSLFAFFAIFATAFGFQFNRKSRLLRAVDRIVGPGRMTPEFKAMLWVGSIPILIELWRIGVDFIAAILEASPRGGG